MRQPKSHERLELDQDLIDAVLAFAERNHMSPKDALRRAVDQYMGAAPMPTTGGRLDNEVKSLTSLTAKELSGAPDDLAESTLASATLEPAPKFVSRHPDRDYSSFGSMKGKFPEGVAYQNAIRDEW